MIVARLALVVAGAALAGFGVVALAQTLSLGALLGVAVWLVGAVTLHDGVLVPVIAVLRHWLRRTGRAWPRGATAAIELGAMVAGALVIFAGAELIAQGQGNANPTILQGDYAQRLLTALLVVAAAVAVVVWALVRRDRRSRR